jgi:hypothetical protein
VVDLLPLSPDELKAVCEAGESAARQFVFSRVDKRLVKLLDISITTEKKDGTTFSAAVSLELEQVVDEDPEALADLAAEAALEVIDKKMRSQQIG